MPSTIKIAYGSTAGTTAKSNSAAGELSFSPTNEVLWIGKGSNTQVAIGGPGKFVTLDAVNQTIQGTKTFSSTISGSISGNAGTATTLATARTINGTSFNGSADITTTNWGTARDITIGSTTRSVNGSATYSWSLGDIGAAATSHAHGNITSAGAIGSTASLPIITTTSGVLTTGSFGTTANTFCQGNDSRLSDARTPVGTSLTSGQIYVGSALNAAAAVAMSGDATIAAGGALTIANDAVTFAKMQNSASAGLSVIGRSTNSAGDFAEINAATDGHVLRRSGTSVGFGEIATAGIANNAVTVAKIETISAKSILGRNANTTGAVSAIAASGNNQYLKSTTTGLEWVGIIDGSDTNIHLKGSNALVPSLPARLGAREVYYTSVDAKLYSVRGIVDDENSNDIILLAGGTELIMYSDAAPEAEDSYLILSSVAKLRLSKVTYILSAGTCTNAKLKRVSGANTNDIVTFNVNTTQSNTTSLNATHREIAVGDKLIFNPGTLSTGTTPADLVIQIEYIPGAEGTFI